MGKPCIRGVGSLVDLWQAYGTRHVCMEFQFQFIFNSELDPAPASDAVLEGRYVASKTCVHYLNLDGLARDNDVMMHVKHSVPIRNRKVT